ncbi:MAG TPA: protein kinase [Mycobacteriales bacterium]|jgi:8-oxo-dGTP pyrophosphatase MutT (NUDIX family)|nr:protein kinase [Mycobacteriales bacterium]
MTKRSTKVLAYVVDGDRVCVFEQPASPDAGVQVPAGTVEPGEDPERAALREAVEETGLAGLEIVRYLGATEFDMAPFGRDEVQRRHVYELRCTGAVPERWTHEERYATGQDPIRFDLYWLPIGEARARLIASHGALLHRVGSGDGADALLGDPHEPTPFHPTPYFLAQLRRQGVPVREVLSFTGLNTIARLDDDRVAKGFFGYYTVLRHIPQRYRPECYGYYWYRELDATAYATWLERFRVEARLLTELRGHPNVIRVDSHDLDAEIPYYVMRFAPGGSLDAHLRRFRARGEHLPLDVVHDFAAQLLDGLQALHDAGYAHRDVTPENVFLDGDRVLLGDLGYVRRLDGEPEEPAPKDPMFYWPPEFDEAFHVAGPQADVYGFGMVLHRMLTHTLPRFGSSLAPIADRCGPEWAELVARCVDPDQGRRYASVADCAAALQAIDAS